MTRKEEGNPYLCRVLLPILCDPSTCCKKGTVVTIEKSVEHLTLDDTDKKNAEKLRKSFLKVLSKDKRSEEIHLEFRYNAFMKCAE